MVLTYWQERETITKQINKSDKGCFHSVEEEPWKIPPLKLISEGHSHHNDRSNGGYAIGGRHDLALKFATQLKRHINNQKTVSDTLNTSNVK